jgi:ADP-heptose:LPS heptosyltransferase
MMFSQKKVVMITPERLGDTLMCTPAIHYLKSQCPEIEIHVIALSDLSAEVLQNNPAIHKIYILPSYKFIRSLKDYFDFGINIHYGKVVQNYMELIKSFSIPIFEIPKVKPLFHQAEQCLEFMQSIVSENPEISERSYKLYPDDKDKKHIEALFNVKKIDPKKDILIGCQIGCHSLAKKRIFFRKTGVIQRFGHSSTYKLLLNFANSITQILKLLLPAHKTKKNSPKN